MAFQSARGGQRLHPTRGDRYRSAISSELSSRCIYREGLGCLNEPRATIVLAQAIYDVMYAFLRDTAPESVEKFTDFGLDKYASGVLLKSDMPSAMMDPLFMSNPAEAYSLTVSLNNVDENRVVVLADDGKPALNDECADFECRRGQIAQAIHDGIVAYVQGGGGDGGDDDGGGGGPPCDSPPCGRNK